MDQTPFILILIGLLTICGIFGGLLKHFFPNTNDQKNNNQKKESSDRQRRDPVLHYEATKGNSGDPKRQSLTYSGKKIRWR
jgi:hypothetical protein